MFSTFKILVISLIIQSRCANTSPTKTLNSGELVEKELAPIRDIIKKIIDSRTSNDEKLELKGELQGKMEEIVKRAIKADRLLMDLAALGKEKERNDVYRVLLGIGHRVDQLERILSAGSDIVLGGDRDKRWIKILKLETPIVKEFRNRMIKEGLDVNLFAKNVQQICQERNDRAGHDVSLPEELQENSIHQILTLMKIPKDQNTVITLKLLVSPLTLPSTTPEPKSK